MKPFDGGGWKNVSRVNTLEELWFEYDQTGTLCMTLQEFIHFDQFVRCYCIGQEEVMIMPYDPTKPYLSGEQYINNPNYLTAELAERITNDVRTLCRALGYDINTVEFAIKDGLPFAIDFMNPAPDAELASVGEFYHNWVTRAVTDLVFKRLEEKREQPRYRWDALLNPEQSGQPLQRAAAAAAGGTESASPAREVGSSIVSGVGDIVADAANAVSEMVESVITPKQKTTRGAKKESGTPARKTATKRAPRAKKPPAEEETTAGE